MTALELMDSLGEVDEEMLWPALNTKTHRSYRRALRAVLIAAAVLVLLALAALAASESGLLESLFPGKYDLIADYVTHVEAVTENDVLRLTLHEAVTDGSCAALIFSVERLDGGSLVDFVPTAKIAALGEDGIPLRSGASETAYLPVDEETESHRWYLWFTYGRTGLHRVSLRLEGMMNWKTEERRFCEPLTAETVLEPCPVKLGKRNGDPEAKELYPSIVLSPISLSIRSFVNVAGMTPENAILSERVHNGPSGCTVELIFKDGKYRDISENVLRQIVTLSTGEDLLTCVFKELLDISLVKSLRIDGVEYALSAGAAPISRGTGMVPGGDWKENMRAWTFGDHTPVYPDLRDDAGAVGIALKAIWTDGYTTELLVQVEAERAEKIWEPVNAGGLITLSAEDKRGESLAVGVLFGGARDGLVSMVVECSGKAAQLTVGEQGSKLTIPLDMKKLAKLPQTEH